MPTQADKIVSALRPIAPEGGLLGTETTGEIGLINQLGALWEARIGIAPPAASSPATRITARVALEIVGHEAIVLEAYKDSEGIWTWGVGVTDRSGHSVGRYKDNPATVEQVLTVYIWLLRERYLPAVIRAFHGFALSEAQLAAALSFHYNTGAIERASWVDLAKAGKNEEAKAAFMQWRKPASIIERRTKERDLFFEGRWTNDGTALVIPVLKPSYQPSFRGAKRVDIRDAVATALAA
jgi:lysozyme